MPEHSLKLNLDMDKMKEVLATQPRFTVSSTTAGKTTTLVEAMRVKGLEGALDDNQVNVLC